MEPPGDAAIAAVAGCVALGAAAAAEDDPDQCRLTHLLCPQCGRPMLNCDAGGTGLPLTVADCPSCGYSGDGWTAVGVTRALEELARPGGPLATDLWLDVEGLRPKRDPCVQYPPVEPPKYPPWCRPGAKVFAKKDIISRGAVVVHEGTVGTIMGPAKSQQKSMRHISHMVLPGSEDAAVPGQNLTVDVNTDRASTDFVDDATQSLTARSVTTSNPRSPSACTRLSGHLHARADIGATPLSGVSDALEAPQYLTASRPSSRPATGGRGQRTPAAPKPAKVCVRWERADGSGEVRTDCDPRGLEPAPPGLVTATGKAAAWAKMRVLLRCGICARHQLAVERDGHEHLPGPDAYGVVLPLGCSGCLRVHTDWEGRTLLNQATGKQQELERLELRSFGSPPWLQLDPDPSVKPRMAALIARQQAGAQTTAATEEARWKGPTPLQALLREHHRRRQQAAAVGAARSAGPAGGAAVLYMPSPPRYMGWCRRLPDQHVCGPTCSQHNLYHPRRPVALREKEAAGSPHLQAMQPRSP
eukprot:TRINITY_DN13935_c0_g1_i1.p1 TRINITY_DN13935_c0_g1~~TRINITY_DN13935_c0_g1_i1.p1  ORF type:complete len:530 (+),score=74.59 TRINITY_DN13935_c0_g1_i1:62-1651(+)